MKKFTTDLEKICLIAPVETEEDIIILTPTEAEIAKKEGYVLDPVKPLVTEEELRLKKLVFIPHDPMWEEELAERRKQHSECIKIGEGLTQDNQLKLYEVMTSQNNRDYKLDEIMKEDVLGKIPFDIRPCEDLLPLLERTSHVTSTGKKFIGYKNIGFIPHSIIGNVSNMSALADMAIRRLVETTPELLGGCEPRSFAIRAVDGQVVSFDCVANAATNENSIKIDSLSMHPNVDTWMANDDFVMSIEKDNVYLSYTTLGGYIGALGAAEFWECKNDASYVIGTKAKKKNVKKARKAVSGKTAAGALFKSLLGRKK